MTLLTEDDPLVEEEKKKLNWLDRCSNCGKELPMDDEIAYQFCSQKCKEQYEVENDLSVCPKCEGFLDPNNHTCTCDNGNLGE